jgi:hypothetical protein
MTSYSLNNGGVTNPYTLMVNAYTRESFYGRHADLQLLERSLQGPTTKSMALVGSPKIGKTALLLTYCGLARREATRLVLYLDCKQRSPDEILERIATELLIQREERELLSNEQRELQACLDQLDLVRGVNTEQRETLCGIVFRTLRLLARTNQFPVICLDHFVLDPEAVAPSLPFREWSANASFIFAVEPDWLEEISIKAPFMDMLFVRRIGLMPFDEVQELINAPLGDLPIQPWLEEEMKGIYWIAGGNPYMLAIVCEQLFAERIRGSSVLSPHLFRRDERLVEDIESLPAISQYFMLIWQRLKPAAQTLLYEASNYTGKDSSALGQIDDRVRGSAATSELRNWSLIDKDAETGNLMVSSRLLQRFVRNQEAPLPATTDQLTTRLDEFERALRGNNEGLLLQVLRANPGMVLSVEELRRKVWKDSNEGDRHVVDQTLSRLRKRLRDQLGIDDLIRSVRGQGYVFVTPDRERDSSGQ